MHPDSTSSDGSSPPVPVTVQPWRWWIHLLLIAAYPLFIGVVGWSEGAARGPALSKSPHGLLVASTVELAIFGAILGAAWMASRATRDDLLLRWRSGWWTLPLGIGYSVALRLAVGVALLGTSVLLVAARLSTPQALQHFYMAHRPDVGAIVDVSAMRRNPVYFWLIITFVSFVLAGLREELWRSAFLGGMRSLWPKRFGSRSGQIAAAAIAAVLFGCGHLPQGLIAVVLAGLLGFGLGLIMVLHRSIWPAVVAHGMFDATSLALLPWAMERLQAIQHTLGH